MKTLILFVLLILPAVALGQGKTTQFTDKEFPISLSYSSQWTVLESDDAEGGRIILVSTTREGNIEAFFTLVATTEPDLKDTSADDFADIMLDDPDSIKSSAMEVSNTATELEFKKSEIAGNAAAFVRYRYIDEEEGVKNEVIRFESTMLVDGNVYGLTFIIDAGSIEKWGPEINAIMSSVKIKPPKPAVKH